MTEDQEELLDQILADYLAKQEDGEAVDPEELIAAHPDLAEEIREFLVDQQEIAGLASPVISSVHQPPQLDKIRYFGDYELLEEIARGGMGIVYKAQQTSLNRIVAIKMILAGNLASDQEAKRFQTEAEAAANLKHPHIVAVYEVGRYDGQHYFSMDFIHGQNLSEIVREHPLPPKTAARYVQQIAEAIHYAHQQGTLHRDLKPSNILIDENEEVQVTDFGLAIRVEGDSALTQTGQILGTPSYIPPEQAEAKRGLIGPCSDIYSLGAILPFRAESPVETIRQVIEREPPSPRLLNPTVPRDLETICLKCLEKEPHKRYLTSQQFTDDLQRFVRGEPIHARPISRLARLWRWGKRNPAMAGLSVALVLAVGIGFAGITSQWLRAEANTQKAAEEAIRAKLEQEKAETSREKADAATGIAKKEAETAREQRDRADREAENAEKQFQRANREAKESKKQTNRAEWLLYTSQIRLAQLEFEKGNTDLAHLYLSRCRSDFRGWEFDYLRKLFITKQDRQHLKPGNFAGNLAFTPDGNRLIEVLRGQNPSVSIWDSRTGKEIRSFSSSVFSV